MPDGLNQCACIADGMAYYALPDGIFPQGFSFGVFCGVALIISVHFHKRNIVGSKDISMHRILHVMSATFIKRH